MTICPGAVVLVHLCQPTEKLWGILERLDGIGVELRALSIATFDDWTYQAASGEPPAIGLSAVFVPMARVERIFLDEQVGAVESYSERFERRVGVSVQSFLG